MRALKFRIWDEIFKFYVGEDELYLGITFDGKCLIYQDEITDEVEFTKIDNFIVEQYTGLKDKNGKEIYEGDIIRVQNGEHTMLPTEKKADCSEVVFEWGAFKYLSDNGNENTMEHLYPYNLEVIGNVHENPELAGGEK